MRITWIGDDTGMDLRPVWLVESAQVLLVKNLSRDGMILGNVFVLCVKATPEQTRALLSEFGAGIKVGILGLEVLPLIAGRPVWTWLPPPGYETRVKTHNFSGFELLP